MMEPAVHIVNRADLFVVVGTSLVVYPAAGLVNYTRQGIPLFVLDKKLPYIPDNGFLTCIEKPATEGISLLRSKLTHFS